MSKESKYSSNETICDYLHFLFLYVFYYHHPLIFFFFFFNDTATTEIYTLSLHDALPISETARALAEFLFDDERAMVRLDMSEYMEKHAVARTDRKSTRLNSSHSQISYAVFCLKKKKQKYAIGNF